MPKSLIKKNFDELLNFTTFTKDDIAIIDGTPKQRMEQLSRPNVKIFLMGFRRFTDDWKLILEKHPTVNALIVDEFHLGGYRSPKSRASTELANALKKINYLLIMTGTLISGRLDSCYMAIKMIEPRYYVNHFSFLNQHALVDEYGNPYMWINHEKLGRIFKRHCIRRKFAEVYGAEEKIIEKVLVEMCPAVQKAYDEFAANAMLELDDEWLEANNPGVNALRCRQILAHPETFGLVKKDHTTGKDEMLEIDIVDAIERKEPIAIFSSLVPEQERIYKLAQKLGARVGLINGSVSGAARSKIDEAFRAGELDIVIGSPATMAVGFNWSHINTVIFVSIDYDNTNFVQAYRRGIRGVRTTPLRIRVYEYEKSIEQRMFEIVDKKSRDLSKVDDSYEKLELSKNIVDTLK